MEKTINIAVVPGVGYSHLVPILQFSKLLVHLHPYIHVTCLIPILGSPPSSSKAILQTLPSNINYTFLQPVHPKDLLPQGTTLASQLQLTLTHSLPFIHQALKSLTLRTPLVALVVDCFAVEALDFAKEFNMLSYMYYPGSATTLALSFYLPKLDQETSLTSSGDDANRGLECLTWLDKQQPCSVLYVSFGSGGTLSQEQIVELAFGLESSNHKFLWVVRAPSSSSSSAAYLSNSAQNDVDVDLSQFLPPGFMERTKEQGMVIPSWAPQIQILSHKSIGGFLSHCGWNSILESVMHGVPLITWPLYAEQKMNAILPSQGLKVGIRPRVNENGIVERVEVSELIKCLMEGEESEKLCNRMKKLKENAINALKEYGSSTKTLSQLAIKWRNMMQEN
ncbi:unnamed protein product [Trifolium pratense]|uniref:Uncharacterized protein n=1 Tax=Trifolium pratense TaxID=57577 RepID=A0ACB0L9Q7_TRIPR|nr:unnamed protein product [Trifolium pratense]